VEGPVKQSGPWWTGLVLLVPAQLSAGIAFTLSRDGLSISSIGLGVLNALLGVITMSLFVPSAALLIVLIHRWSRGRAPSRFWATVVGAVLAVPVMGGLSGLALLILSSGSLLASPPDPNLIAYGLVLPLVFGGLVGALMPRSSLSARRT
jgi:hypothetical protein